MWGALRRGRRRRAWATWQDFVNIAAGGGGSRSVTQGGCDGGIVTRPLVLMREARADWR